MVMVISINKHTTTTTTKKIQAKPLSNGMYIYKKKTEKKHIELMCLFLDSNILNPLTRKTDLFASKILDENKIPNIFRLSL